MALTVDRFKKLLTDKVSPDLVAHLDGKVTAAIRRLQDEIVELKDADIDAGPYEKRVTELQEQQGKANEQDTTEKKYKALGETRKKARQYTDNARKAPKIEPSEQEIAAMKETLAKGGTQALDAIVDRLDGKAKDNNSKKQVIAAIKARWDLPNLSGDLTTKALPLLYKTMAMVPEDHIKGNTKLTDIRRDRKPGTDNPSFYNKTEDLIVLNLGKTGPWHDSEAEISSDAGVSHTVSRFTHTTLHEIGHAVDERCSYMEHNMGAHGGWQEESIESVAKAGGRDSGFFTAFDHPEAMLTIYLSHILRTGKAEPQDARWKEMQELFEGVDFDTAPDLLKDDPGLKLAEAARKGVAKTGAWPDGLQSPDEVGVAINMKRGDPSKRPKGKLVRGGLVKLYIEAVARVLQQQVPMNKAVADVVAEARPTVPDNIPDASEWEEMAKHAAVAWCLQIRLKGKSNGLWRGGAAAAGAAKLSDDRVYQQSNEKNWWSYDLTARTGNVSSYQFRSPGEYFAELYAAYYLDWLPENHWISTLRMPAPGG